MLLWRPACCSLLLLVSASQIVHTRGSRRAWRPRARGLGTPSWLGHDHAPVLVVGLVFYFVPNTRVRFRDVWLGAVVTGLLWQRALEGFSWYISAT